MRFLTRIKVKVVFSANHTALYFSRNPIPYCRGVERADWLAKTPFYKHVGMYAYRPEILKAVTSIPQGVWNRRNLWNNYLMVGEWLHDCCQYHES